jgi:hypothetical protein
MVHPTCTGDREWHSGRAPGIGGRVGGRRVRVHSTALAVSWARVQRQCVMVRSPCQHSAAVEKRGSREVHFIELQSHSLQQVELEVVSGTIASRGASEILR